MNELHFNQAHVHDPDLWAIELDHATYDSVWLWHFHEVQRPIHSAPSLSELVHDVYWWAAHSGFFFGRPLAIKIRIAGSIDSARPPEVGEPLIALSCTDNDKRGERWEAKQQVPPRDPVLASDPDLALLKLLGHPVKPATTTYEDRHVALRLSTSRAMPEAIDRTPPVFHLAQDMTNRKGRRRMKRPR